MKLEDQVCSLELSKRLKELGVRQSSLFHWHIHPITDQYCIGLIADGNCSGSMKPFSAFTVAELGEILPTKFLWIDKQQIESSNNVYLNIRKLPNSWDIYYSDLDDTGFRWEEYSYVSEANARAKMLIYLIEKGLLKDV